MNAQFSNVQPVEANVVTNEAGVCQPIKSIGEMLEELPKSRKRNDHILESNIIVSTPVFDQCVSDFSMKTKQTPTFKKQELRLIEEAEKAAKERQKGVGQGDGGAVPPVGTVPGDGASQGRGRALTYAKPTGVPGKQASGCKHNLFSALAAATA